MLFEFQTQVAHLTGMEVANASMYDGSTATAEAVLMARRLTRRDSIVLSGGLHPHYRDVVSHLCRRWRRTWSACRPRRPGRATCSLSIDDETAAIVVQTPDFYGHLRNVEEARRAGA